MKVMSIFGTRPEAIKMCPVIKELESREKIKSVVCLTGQHKEMLQPVMKLFEIKEDYNLRIMTENQSLSSITCKILDMLEELLNKEKPDMILVHGDTTSAYAAALSAFYHNIPVGHVEAGLRTYNMHSPFPEEFNRQSIDLVSDILFAPTQYAKDMLLSEKKGENKIFVTGNTVIDALKTTVCKSYNITECCEDDKLILLTAHRRENIGEPMKNIFSAVNKITEDYPEIKVIYPVHKNPKIREIANQFFANNSKVKMIEPMDVYDFHNVMNKSYLILTDSGGIQEEATSLGKPVLILRDTTERPEGVAAGTLKIVGTQTENIYLETKRLLTDKDEYNRMSKSVNPYGDGNASKTIVDIVERYFEGKL